MRNWPLVLLVLCGIGVAAAQSESQDLRGLLEQRVRIQSPSLGPGWHEGLFNRQRSEPICYVVLVWKPRPAADSPLQLESIVQLGAVSELQAYSGQATPLQTWAGRKPVEATDASLWRPIPQALLDRNRNCPVSAK